MKKVLSIILSLVMLVSVSALSMTAFATVGSQETVTQITHNKIIPQVNGKDDGDVTWEWLSDDPKQIKFTYDGDGDLEDWEFGDLEEGVDYKVISRDGNAITIELMDTSYDGDIVANAIVNDEEEEEEETTTKANTTTKKNESKTSPKTGAAAAAGIADTKQGRKSDEYAGIAAMGAGVAILTAIKKKED